MAFGNLSEKMEIAKRKRIAGKIRNLLIDVGQKDEEKFKSDFEIRYTPTEVYDIIMEYGVDINIAP